MGDGRLLAELGDDDGGKDLFSDPRDSRVELLD
jgi:hypothetical protein